MSAVTCPPAHSSDRGVPDLSVVKDRHVGGSAPQLDDGAAELDLVGREDRQRRRQRLQDELLDVISRALDALLQVLQDAGEHRDEVDLGLQPRPRHADRLVDPALLVDQIVLRNGVQQLVVPPEADVARHVVDPRHIAGPDLVARDADHAVRAAPRHVLARDAAVGRPHFDARHTLGALHRFVDGPGGFFDVTDHAAPDPAGLLRGHAQDPSAHVARIARDLRDGGDDLGRAEVERRHQPLRLRAHARARRTIT